MRRRIALFATPLTLLALLALAVAAPPALAAPTIDGEFPVTGLDANNKIVQGPDGNIWVTVSENGEKTSPGSRLPARSTSSSSKR